MMNSDFANKSSDIIGEACAWIAQLETGVMSQADMQAFQEWIQRSPVHYNEIKRLAQLSADANVLTNMSYSMTTASKERRLAVRKASSGLARLKPVFVTCLVSFCVFITGYSGYKYSRLTEPFLLTTAIGGFEETILTDGTQVTLNTASQVEIDFTKKRRRVRLLNGEALFDVAHDSSRPFIVLAGDKSVRAVGTAFAVRLIDGDLSVTVSEGKVQFAPVTTEAVSMSVKTENAETEVFEIASVDHPILLKAGQKLSLPNKLNVTQTASVRDSHVQTDLAWSARLWDFENRPLVEVIAEMNRYTDMRIEFAEADLSHVRFDGLFRTDDLEGLLEGLNLLEDIKVVRINQKHVRIEYVEN